MEDDESEQELVEAVDSIVDRIVEEAIVHGVETRDLLERVVNETNARE